MILPSSLLAQIQKYHEGQDAGHDWAHIQRVVKLAALIGEAERADLAILIPAAYLHDIVNVPKDHPERARASELAANKAVSLLAEADFLADKLPAVHQTIVEHSWSKGLKPSTIEAAVLQDADRLDALGAIGILRCAAVNVHMKGSFYNPEDPWAERRPLDDKRWMVDHYPAKLYKLPDSMNTQTARVIAHERVAFMQNFMGQLAREI